MTLFHLVILALVQGITEFLPISSHAHLILTREVLNMDSTNGLMTDVAVHVGTLAAVLVYFRADVWQMVVGVARLASGRGGSATRLLLLVAVATPPVMVAGYLVQKYLGDVLTTVTVIGWATLGFALVLYVADRWGMTLRRLDHLSYGEAMLIGLFQVLALIPGTSRSGITMTAARLFGFERSEAARFSMLLSIPAIAAAGLWVGYKIYQSGDAQIQSDALIAAALAFVAALLAISLMMRWLTRATFTPFVIYRVLLGAGLLIWVYS